MLLVQLLTRSITYTDVSISEDGTLTVIKVIADGGVFWRFKMAKEALLEQATQTDTDGDGIIDAWVHVQQFRYRCWMSSSYCS